MAAQQMTLQVPEISCEHCVHTINTTLSALPGVEHVSTDIPTKTVKLSYDPQAVSLEQIRTALDEEGYTIAS